MDLKAGKLLLGLVGLILLILGLVMISIAISFFSDPWGATHDQLFQLLTRSSPNSDWGALAASGIINLAVGSLFSLGGLVVLLVCTDSQSS